MEWNPIGIIRTPFTQPAGTPIQSAFAAGAPGTVELFPEFADGLQDLGGFDRVWLLYCLDRAPAGRLRVIPFRDTVEHGVFATRSPCRPNPLGLSCVRLLAVEGRMLRIADVDMLDGTPLLDIKPYVPRFDAFPASRAGWFDTSGVQTTHADNRFASSPETPP